MKPDEVKIGKLVHMDNIYTPGRNTALYRINAFDRENNRVIIIRLEHSNLFKAVCSAAEDGILLPNGNQEIYKAIDSAVKQIYPDFDWIYVNRESYCVNPADIFYLSQYE